MIIFNCSIYLGLKIDNFIVKTETTIRYLKKFIPDLILKDNLESKNIVLEVNRHIIRNNINFCKLYF